MPGKTGKRDCPPVAGIRVGIAGQLSPSERAMFSVGLVFRDGLFPVQALIDSGADQSFIRTSLAQKLGLA